MTFEEFLGKYNLEFNSQQLAAIKAVDGPVCLLAAPGSGKTRTLVARVGYLILCCGVNPEHILTMTYTVSATKDMSERFASFFGAELAEKVEFRTLNGVAQRTINMFGRATGKSPYELISDEKERSRYIKTAYINVKKSWPTESDIKDIGAGITLCKNMLYSDEEIKNNKTEIDDFDKIYFEYCRLLREAKKMDFDDQLVTCYKILSKVPEMLNSMQEKYQYICLDEAQDTSKVQHEIVGLLAQKSRKLFMVGDEDQSIYKFRGAYPEGLLDFTKRYPDGRVLLMEQNYRSDANIVKAADAFIQKNTLRHAKHILPTRPAVNRIKKETVPSKYKQYDRLIGLLKAEEKQTAVLARNNESLIPVVDRLEKEQISYNIRQMDLSFFTHPTVTDIRNFMALALDPNNADAFLAVYYKCVLHLKKEVATAAANIVKEDGENIVDALNIVAGKKFHQKDKIRDFSKCLGRMQTATAKMAIGQILNTLEYEDYLSANHISKGKVDILRGIAENTTDIKDFLYRLDELQDIIANKARDPGAKIVLSTVHSSKGLEYDGVCLIDAYDGCFPEKVVKGKASKEEIAVYEEERRLYYVGITRGKNRLTVFTYEDAQNTFTDELFKGIALTPYKVSMPDLPSDDKGYQEFEKKLQPGVIVRHQKFGVGEICNREGSRATINFARSGQKIIMLDFAYMRRMIDIL